MRTLKIIDLSIQFILILLFFSFFRKANIELTTYWLFRYLLPYQILSEFIFHGWFYKTLIRKKYLLYLLIYISGAILLTYLLEIHQSNFMFLMDNYKLIFFSTTTPLVVFYLYISIKETYKELKISK